MEYKYMVEKYAGRTYCGNGLFDTLEECYTFANDGFCDKMKIRDTEEGKLLTVKIEEELKTFYIEYFINEDSYKYCTYITAKNKKEACQEFSRIEKDLKSICICEKC